MNWISWEALSREALLLFFAGVMALIFVLRAARREAAPDDSGKDLGVKLLTSLAPFLDDLSRISLPLLTVAGATLAFAYNIGYFWAVGVIFMSLFSVQEHIVFALSGLVELAIFIGAAVLINNIFRLIPDKGKSHRPILYYLLMTFAIYIALSQLHDWLQRTDLDAGIETASALFFVYVCAASLLLVMRHPGLRRSMFVIFIVLVTSSLALGIRRGSELVRSNNQHKTNIAVTKTGERLGIVRVGADYTIVVSPTRKVSAIRTAELAEIRADKSPIAP